jgi:hypothetical protein
MIRLLRFALVLTFLAGPVLAQTNSLDGILSGLREQPLNPVLLREVKASLAGVPDPALRCRYGVLYALGSLASGNREEGLAARAALRKAYPENNLLQDLADARLSRPCGDCEEGSVLDPCAACAGSGRCSRCKGTGQQTVPGLGTEPRKVMCMVCADRPGKCKTCAGTKGTPKACPVCAGSGRVMAPEKANVLYMRLLKALAPPPEAQAPVILVVTAAPPDAVEADPAVVRAEVVERALAAAREQTAGCALLQKYPLAVDDIRSLRDPELTPARREELVAGLMKKGLAHPTRGRCFFLPFPAGLTYSVADVVKNPYGGYFLRLTSTPPSKKGPPVQLTPREVLDDTARAICEPMGSFLSDPTVCVPDGDPKTGALRKGEVIQSGAWLVPVQFQWGKFEKAGSCYRSPDELLTQMGFNR